MEETIIKAAILVSFIFCGYTLKQLRLFGRSTFNTISTIVFNITLPSVIVVNLNGIHFDTRYLLISLLAIIFNLVMVAMGYAAGRTKDEKAFYMLNMNGYNIGNFALPFVSYFFDSAAVLIVCIFDAGNSLMCLGGAYGLARCVRGEKGESIVMILAKTIFSSIPVLSYITMITLSLAGFSLPQVVIDWAKIPASANTFLSMLMIGVALGLSLKKEYLHLHLYRCGPAPAGIRRYSGLRLFCPRLSHGHQESHHGPGLCTRCWHGLLLHGQDEA
jgi:predicted permease